MTLARPGWRPRRRYLVLAGAAAVGGLLEFAYKYMDYIARGIRPSPLMPFVEEMTAAFGGALILGAGLNVVRRYALRRATWLRSVIVLMPLAIAASGVHTTLNWLSRTLIFAALGRHYDYGTMSARYLMELPMDLMVLSIFVAAVNGWDNFRRIRKRELDAARLQGRLAHAELRNLRGQLEPHFLFNALNAISERMYEDPAAADEMIGHLSELLRTSLKSGDASEVPLRLELESLGHYLALLDARFGRALIVSMHVNSDAREALVPPMLLQPIVENAVRHGGITKRGHGAIVVLARHEGHSLILEVSDDGAGLAGDADPFASGIGLNASRERLRILHGDSARMEAGNAEGGGFLVRVKLPFRSRPSIPAVSPTTNNRFMPVTASS